MKMWQSRVVPSVSYSFVRILIASLDLLVLFEEKNNFHSVNPLSPDQFGPKAHQRKA